MCVYNVGHANLDYHRHTHVSDITYCAAGRLMLELPQLGKSYVFHPGQIVQVPYDTIHRVSHYSDSDSHSRYILVQIGKFSIDFIKDDGIVAGENPTNIRNKGLNFYIGDQGDRLRNIAAEFRERRPDDLSDSEYADVLAALDTVCHNGIARSHTNEVVLRKLTALES